MQEILEAIQSGASGEDIANLPVPESYRAAFVRREDTAMFEGVDLLRATPAELRKIRGAVAGMIRKGQGFGVLLNIVIGIVGGVIGGWLFSLVGADPNRGLIGSIVTATIGAVLLLWIAGKLKN